MLRMLHNSFHPLRKITSNGVFIAASIVALFFVAGCGGGRSTFTPTPNQFRTVAIPKRENGYSNFESQVIESKGELNRFLSETASQTNWNEKEAFVQAIQQANLNFDKEALVLIRDDEGSGGIRVTMDTPEIRERKFVSTLRVSLFLGGTGDMAIYAFAFAIPKSDVDEVNISIDDPNPAQVGLPPKSPIHLTVTN